MSLINDALKRTKAAQQQNPPPPDGPPLRPADPKPANSGSGAQMLLFVLVAAIIVGNLLLWLAFNNRGAKTVEARTSEPVAAPVQAAAPEAVPAAMPAPAPAPTPAAIPAPTNAPVPQDTASAVTTITNAPEAAPAVVFVKPTPAPLRLQSIIYNPSRPSAMIGGKFLFLGDRIQGFRVTAIDHETVTLVGNGETNVLSLP